MTAQIIDGRAAAAVLRAKVVLGVADFRARRGRAPGLAVVLVGDDPASQVYVRSKVEQSASDGFLSRDIKLPAETTQAQVIETVEALNRDPSIDGVLIQLPLPPWMDARAVLARLDPAKDVDGLTDTNVARLAARSPGLTPCTPLGCMMLLSEALGDLTGLRAVVLGRSMLVGRPIAQLLVNADCTVTIAHSRSRDLAAICREADILVAAVGRPGMVRGDWIKPGAAVIDVGINAVPSLDPARAAEGGTRLVGDVSAKEARAVAGWITPVPGGVGPMTVACLLYNTLTAAERAVAPVS